MKRKCNRGKNTKVRLMRIELFGQSKCLKNMVNVQSLEFSHFDFPRVQMIVCVSMCLNLDGLREHP